MKKDAYISDCETYRYNLSRIWEPELGLVNFIGLNPSTADANENDPTIHKCIRYAKVWGYGGIVMTNLFAFRTPYPDEMEKADDPVGSENDKYLVKASEDAAISISVWGDGGLFQNRGFAVAQMVPDLLCLKVSYAGQPRHVRFLKGDLKPISMPEIMDGNMAPQKIRTLDDVSVDINQWKKSYKYQEQLTRKLDQHDDDFNQDVINEIVLWKVSRYAKMTENTLGQINGINKHDRRENKELTEEILKGLLEINGFGLPMATTVLRFRNPHIYQLIDQRVYRFIFGKKMPTTTKTNTLIQMYREYLDQLRKLCKRHGIEFSEADRILYQADIIENKDIKLKGYG